MKQLYYTFEPVVPIFIMLFVIIVIAFLFINRRSGHELNSKKRKFMLMLYVGFMLTIVGTVLVTLMPTGYQNNMVQFVPFASIAETWEFATPRAIVNSLVMNVLLFIPFGFFLYLIIRKGFLTAVIVSLASLSIESLQFLLPIGRVSNIDDVILNTIGGILGMLIAVIILRLEIVYNAVRKGKK